MCRWNSTAWGHRIHSEGPMIITERVSNRRDNQPIPKMRGEPASYMTNACPWGPLWHGSGPPCWKSAPIEGFHCLEDQIMSSLAFGVTVRSCDDFDAAKDCSENCSEQVVENRLNVSIGSFSCELVEPRWNQQSESTKHLFCWEMRIFPRGEETLKMYDLLIKGHCVPITWVLCWIIAITWILYWIIAIICFSSSCTWRDSH